MEVEVEERRSRSRNYRGVEGTMTGTKKSKMVRTGGTNKESQKNKQTKRRESLLFVEVVECFCDWLAGWHELCWETGMLM